MNVSDVQSNMDLLWIMIASAMVLLMQGGFTALESGVTRQKNTINVAAKNMIDFVAAVLTFFLVGYALMFGSSAGGWIGTNGFALFELTEPSDYAFWAFQAVFVGTAATIVSGAVAERCRFSSYILVSVVVSAFIYPVSGHWIWSDGGWLSSMGFVDFAGSTVVHSLGAWIGLAGAIVLGPRLGRFNEDGSANEIPGHSLVLAVIGVLVLWFGWFGFNGGSELSANDAVPLIIVNTMLSAAAGGATCFLISFFKHAVINVERMLNGVIGGLVAVTAGAAILEPWSAVAVGVLGGLITYVSDWGLLELGIDDPVRVVPAHGFSGAAGTIALAVLAPTDALPTGSVLSQLWVQTLGVSVVAIWGLGCGFLLFRWLQGMGALRVTAEGEEQGLNVHEHGTKSTLLDAARALQSVSHATSGGEANLSLRIPFEPNSEAGEIANITNQLLSSLDDTVSGLRQKAANARAAAKSMDAMSATIVDKVGTQSQETATIVSAITEITSSVEEVSTSASQTASSSETIRQSAFSGYEDIEASINELGTLGEKLGACSEEVTSLEQDATDIETVLSLIRNIAGQTNLLALNASIEATRASNAGSGAVIAEKIRELAQESEKATESIDEVVSRIQGRIKSAANSMHETRQQMEQTEHRLEKTRSAFASVRESVEELAQHASQVAAAAEQQAATLASIRERVAASEGLGTDMHSNAQQGRNVANELLELLNVINDSLAGFSTTKTETVEPLSLETEHNNGNLLQSLGSSYKTSEAVT